MFTFENARAEFLSLGDDLKRCRGQEYEDHDHPAVLMDRATNPSVRVWGWWADTEPRLPCILWSSERGWSATVVEPDGIDAPGYELAYWSHRVKLLDLALANALGPFRTLTSLELHVAGDTTPPILDPHAFHLREALLWGIVQLRAARVQEPYPGVAEVSLATVRGPVGAGRIDDELTKHALAPTIAKRRKSTRWDTHKDPAVGALVRALSRLRLVDHRTASADADGRKDGPFERG